MRHLLLGLVVLLAVAPAASAAQLDDAAAALRSSPVYVAPDAKPEALGHRAAAPVRGAIANADTPVFVAVVPASALDETGGDADLFVRRLFDAERQPGTYAVVAGETVPRRAARR